MSASDVARRLKAGEKPAILLAEYPWITRADLAACLQMTRRPRKRGEIQDHLPRLLAAQRNICPLCGGEILPSHARVVDHWKPWRLTGNDRLANLRAVHWRCNIVKADRLDIEQVKRECAGLRPYLDNGVCNEDGCEARTDAALFCPRHAAERERISSATRQRDRRAADPEYAERKRRQARDYARRKRSSDR